MSRSLKKGPFIDTPLLEKVEAMNPVDHPLGGGEGKTSGGRHPVSPWGMPTKGYKTRNRKATDRFVIQRRPK